MSEQYLTEKFRAEDILLGSLGYGEEARLISVRPIDQGYTGVGQWPDGETFEFKCTEELDELQRWALKVLQIT